MNQAPNKVKSRRKMRNFLLQPKLQMRLGFSNIVLAFLFCIALGAYLYMKLVEFADVIVTVTEADEMIYTMLNEYLADVALNVTLGGILFLLINLAFSIWITHRMVGPTIAFRRQIANLNDGNFKSRIKLRIGDAFKEVAEDLNKLGETLEKKYGK